ncbi:MAG: DMT family transporter [Chloroflexi bacterium]|nr:DMT family transporter [Chloroflexota bacterium]
MNYGMLILLALIWGSSFLFIKVAVAEVSPLYLVQGRLFLALLFLYAFLRLRGQRLPRGRKVWIILTVIGLFNNALPFTLISWGEQYIDSGVAAVFNGTMPLFTVIIAHFLTRDDRMNLAKMIGVLIGFGGVAVMIGADLAALAHANVLGELAVMGAACGYGLSTTLVKKYLHNVPPEAAATGQLLASTIWLALIIVVTGQPLPAMPSAKAAGSIIALGVMGTGIAYLIYYRLIKRIRATQMSLVTYLIPITAIMWGVLLLGEQPGLRTFVGMGLILGGVMLSGRK